MDVDTPLVWGRHWFDVALTLYLVLGFLVEAALIEREPGFPRWWHLGWSFVCKKLALSAIFAYALTLAPPPPAVVSVEGRVLRIWVAVAITWELAALAHAKWQLWRVVRQS